MDSENLRLILPLLRPRSDELGWYAILLVIVLCAGLATLAALYILRNRRQAAALKKRFLQRCRELKLKSAHAALLYSIAQNDRMNNPLLLLSSLHVFDQHVGAYADELAQRNAAHPQLEILDAIRAWLDFDRIPPGQLLNSTREMPEGQVLDLVRQDTDPQTDQAASWVVVERRAGGLVVAPLVRAEQPKKSKPRLQHWATGQALEATFWHADGIEYAFSTTVLSTNPETHQSSLAHTNDVQHTQQRNFLRVDVDVPLTLYGLPLEEEQALVESLNETLAAHTDPDEQATETVSGDLPEAYSIDLKALPFVQGRTEDLSAGGLALVSETPLPDARYFLLDPHFTGDFPLAGLICRQVRRYQSPQGYHLQAQFVDLPQPLENELVRLINQQQILVHHPPAEPPSGPSGNTS